MGVSKLGARSPFRLMFSNIMFRQTQGVARNTRHNHISGWGLDNCWPDDYGIDSTRWHTPISDGLLA